MSQQSDSEALFRREYDVDTMISAVVAVAAEAQLYDPLPFMADAVMEIHRLRGSGWRPQDGVASYKKVFQELLRSSNPAQATFQQFEHYRFGDTSGGLGPLPQSSGSAPSPPNIQEQIHMQMGNSSTRRSSSIIDVVGMPIATPTTTPHKTSIINLRRGSVSAECMKPPTDETLNEPKIVIPKTDEARHRIHIAIQNNLLFRNLDPEQKTDIINAMFEKKVPAGHTVIRQGDTGDNFYVVDSGHFEIFVNGEKKGEAGPGSTFGELALMYNTLRAATITATKDSVLWAVDRMTFRKTVIVHNYRKRRMYESFLKSVPLFGVLGPDEISNIANYLEPVSFEAGQDVIRQGDRADAFYIIVEGEAKVTMRSPDGSEEREVNRLHSGAYFGELALINHEPRAATVTAVTKLDCVCMEVLIFTRLFGPFVDIMKRDATTYRNFESVCRS
jgi:CRP-like cAMP-binding protein